MALTERLTDIVRNTAYALTASLALANPLANPLYSAEPASPQSSVQKQSEKAPNYEYFKDILKEKKRTNITDSQDENLKRIWPKYTDDYKRTLVEIYTDPEKYLKKLEEKVKELPKEEQEDFHSYFSQKRQPKKQVPEETPGKKSLLLSKIASEIFSSFFSEMGRATEESIVKEYKEQFPWINLYDTDLGDHIIVYLDEKQRTKKSDKLFETDIFK